MTLYKPCSVDGMRVKADSTCPHSGPHFSQVEFLETFTSVISETRKAILGFSDCYNSPAGPTLSIVCPNCTLEYDSYIFPVLLTGGTTLVVGLVTGNLVEAGLCC